MTLKQQTSVLNRDVLTEQRRESTGKALAADSHDHKPKVIGKHILFRIARSVSSTDAMLAASYFCGKCLVIQ